jgi:hypothetical protein
MRLGIGGSSIGRSILGRTLGTVLGGTVAGTAGILTSPYIAIANHLYGPNVRKHKILQVRLEKQCLKICIQNILVI